MTTENQETTGQWRDSSVESNVLLGLRCGLDTEIDWDTVMRQPRYAGGHEEVMRAIFGDRSQVVAWWSEEDYQGTVAIAHQLDDGRVVVMTDYYGSCSGCDQWEDCTDDEARKMVLDLVHHARVFLSVSAAANWCANVDSSERPFEFPFEAAKNLSWPNVKARCAGDTNQLNR